MMTEATASSSSFTFEWPYHVFLSSFRDEDTRYNFTDNLYHDLNQRGIRTFVDDERIMKGENNTDTLFKVIEESKTAIIVFSENYASSTFCLKELVHILKCMKGVEGRSIWCVFCDVDPSDVQHQRNSYKDAFDKYEGVMDMECKNLVDDWGSALKEAADLCSWHVNPRSKIYEYEIREKIVEAVSREIKDGPLYVARYPVALHSQVKEVCSLLFQQPCYDGATMVGIYGPGGIGKTTLVRAVYNEIGNQFKQYSCFLSNIREKSIHKLLKTVLSKTIKEKDIELEYYRSAVIKDRLQRKKVLLILDDVDKLEQLKTFVGEANWFGSGSKIIITTRNKCLLAEHGIKKIHEVKGLDYLDARRLLTLNAFKKERVDPEYESVIKRAVKYASGLPLALEIIGSSFCGLTVEEWKSALDIYERIPNKSIQQVLEVSFHDLEETQKEIFLDIACFYKGCKLEYATSMLRRSSHGMNPDYCIRELIDKSLIEIDKDGCLGMYDLIQVMGQEIVRRESPLEPGKRSRLWSYQDILHVLRENTGSKKIQGIKLDMFHTKSVLEPRSLQEDDKFESPHCQRCKYF